VTRGAQLKKVGDRKERAPSRPSTPPNHQRDRYERRQQVLVVGTVVRYSSRGATSTPKGRTTGRGGPAAASGRRESMRTFNLGASSLPYYSTRERVEARQYKRSVACVSYKLRTPFSLCVQSSLVCLLLVSTPSALPTYCPWRIYERRLATHLSLPSIFYTKGAVQDKTVITNTGMWRFHSHLFLIFQLCK
jgi:hypothetical protein